LSERFLQVLDRLARPVFPAAEEDGRGESTVRGGIPGRKRGNGGDDGTSAVGGLLDKLSSEKTRRETSTEHDYRGDRFVSCDYTVIVASGKVTFEHGSVCVFVC